MPGTFKGRKCSYRSKDIDRRHVGEAGRSPKVPGTGALGELEEIIILLTSPLFLHYRLYKISDIFCRYIILGGHPHKVFVLFE